ncbi:hypothetical protein ACOSQ2_005279 [Xanthoceras sorbifolium]
MPIVKKLISNKANTMVVKKSATCLFWTLSFGEDIGNLIQGRDMIKLKLFLHNFITNKIQIKLQYSASYHEKLSSWDRKKVMHGGITKTKRVRLRKGSLNIWTIFTKYGDRTRCKCNYCGKDYGCTTKNGTKSLWNHVNFQCTKYMSFSSYLSVTSNLFFHELCSIETNLTSLAKSADSVLSEMTSSMKSKFDKYWEKIEDVNKLLIIALVLDPRYKLDYVKFCFGDMFDDKKTKEMTCDIRELLIQLYECYKGVENILSSEQTSSFISLANVYVEKARISLPFRYLL